MNKLSLREFCKFCADRKISRFEFSSGVQNENTVNGVVYEFDCSIVQYTLNPSIICFKNEHNYISFTGVKGIEIIEDVLGMVFVCNVIWKNYTNPLEDNSCCFVAKVEI